MLHETAGAAEREVRNSGWRSTFLDVDKCVYITAFARWSLSYHDRYQHLVMSPCRVTSIWRRRAIRWAAHL